MKQVHARGKLPDLDRRLLDGFQKDFPLSATPFADIAAALGVAEKVVLQRLHRHLRDGTVSRIGPVFRPHTIGASTLAAMSVPAAELDAVAGLISGYAEVNHNYEREHRFNLWFVVTAADPQRLESVLSDIERQTGFEVLRLPLVEDYHIDLGFALQWN
ncbi:MAG: AsnC family transcriptional regulator [Gammaproteobacteria bacterium]|nr:AsnC family transcriptional regulator [Gammaproteobacteria bacterium]